MKQTIYSSYHRPQSDALSEADIAILQAVKRYHYVTATQIRRLLYPNSHEREPRHARRMLARLASRGFLLQLPGLPNPRYGSVPHVYTLTSRGRSLLAVQGYFRPGEELVKPRNHLFMTHTLATIDVLIAAELLCRSQSVSMPRLLTERELKQAPCRVTLPSSTGVSERSVAVIPDAWLELTVATRKPVALAIEVDRGTEDQQRWRSKVHALYRWAVGPYQEHFAADTLTIAVVTPDQGRRDTLRSWTLEELTRLGDVGACHIFLFSAADPVATPPAKFFFTRCWFEPSSDEPTSLLLPPLRVVSAQAVLSPKKEVWPAEE